MDAVLYPAGSGPGASPAARATGLRPIRGRIEPARFLPDEGQVTRVTLPGVAPATRVDVLRLGPGLSVAHSHFAPGSGLQDTIRWPAGRVLIAFNLSGGMDVSVPSGRTHAIRDGEGWVFHTDGGPLCRTIRAQEGCSNLVIVLETEALGERLLALLRGELPAQGTVRSFRLARPPRQLPGILFDGKTSSAALLRKEGECLAMIGQVLEELVLQGDEVPDDAVIAQHVTCLLRERLAETLSLDDLAQGLGISHVTLNRAFRRETGMTVFERLRDLRLEAAADMIRKSARSLTEIAYDCGFSSPGHLSTAFRKRFGMTARDWRRAVPAGAGGFAEWKK